MQVLDKNQAEATMNNQEEAILEKVMEEEIQQQVETLDTPQVKQVETLENTAQVEETTSQQVETLEDTPQVEDTTEVKATPKAKARKKPSKPQEHMEKLTRAEMLECRDICKQMETLLKRIENVDGLKDKMIKLLTKDKKKNIKINGETINLHDSNYIVIDVV